MRPWWLLALAVACASSGTRLDAGGTLDAGSNDGGTSSDAGDAGLNDGGTSSDAGGMGDGGDGGCASSCNKLSEMCCSGTCAATYNDVDNCGGCGITCMGAQPYCNNGTCGPLPACMLPAGTPCNLTGQFCCGTFCCSAGQLCCIIDSNVAMTNPQCAAPVNGTCPIGCPGCP
jgi:hypothetical protein